MEDASQLNPMSSIISSVNTQASTSTAIIQSVRMPTNVSPSARRHTRHSILHRASAGAAAAVHIVSKHQFPLRTRPVSASPLSFTTAAVSNFSQISFLYILKAFYSLRHDRAVATG